MQFGRKFPGKIKPLKQSEDKKYLKDYSKKRPALSRKTKEPNKSTKNRKNSANKYYSRAKNSWSSENYCKSNRLAAVRAKTAREEKHGEKTDRE